MRSRIITITILISFILLIIAMVRGINIGNLEILSISQIKEKNNNLNEKIDKASSLATNDYPKNIEILDKTFEQYTMTKEKYEQLSGLSGEETIEKYETKQYDIGYLWRILGNYAESKNLTLGINVQKSNASDTLYSFSFSVSGEYTKIIEFIKALEDDSDLNFRIYNFKINGTGTILNANFVVENINIDSTTIKSSQNNTKDLFEDKD